MPLDKWPWDSRPVNVRFGNVICTPFRPGNAAVCVCGECIIPFWFSRIMLAMVGSEKKRGKTELDRWRM